MLWPLRSVVALGAIVFIASACKPTYEELPASDCPKVVEHSRRLLGPGAKGKTTKEMLAICEASTPKQRGCAMQATVGADIMKCSLLALTN